MNQRYLVYKAGEMGLMLTSAITFGLFVLFLFGLSSGASGLVLAVMCAWSPACVALGYTLKPIKVSIRYEKPERQSIRPQKAQALGRE